MFIWDAGKMWQCPTYVNREDKTCDVCGANCGQVLHEFCCYKRSGGYLRGLEGIRENMSRQGVLWACSGAPWACSGRALWGLLVPSGAFWGFLAPSGAIWGILVPSGAIWGILVPSASGALCCLLEPSGAFWGLSPVLSGGLSGVLSGGLSGLWWALTDLPPPVSGV